MKFHKGVIHSKDGGILGKLSAMSTYYDIKQDICRRVAPKTIAEIGVRAGYSAWAFLQAAPDAHY